MKINPIIFILLGVILFTGLFFLFKLNTQQENSTTATILMKQGKFEPQTITVQKGTKVVFKNEDTRPRWPASDIHPRHTRYPGSSIEKCGTAEQKNIFDACGIAPRKDYSFVFNEVGNWNYHDHLKPSIFGEIKVVEKL